jgi:hypothetical protein
VNSFLPVNLFGLAEAILALQDTLDLVEVGRDSSRFSILREDGIFDVFPLHNSASCLA